MKKEPSRRMKITRMKNRGATTAEVILLLGVIVLFLTCLALAKEQKKYLTNLLKADSVSFDHSYKEDGSEFEIWKFNKVGDIYDGKTYHHNAKTLNGIPVEIDSKPVKVVIVEVQTDGPEKSVPGQ